MTGTPARVGRWLAAAAAALIAVTTLLVALEERSRRVALSELTALEADVRLTSVPLGPIERGDGGPLILCRVRALTIGSPSGQPVTAGVVRAAVDAANRLGGSPSVQLNRDAAPGALAPLADLAGLDQLFLDGVPLRDDDLRDIARIGGLRSVDLSRTGVGDEVVAVLEAMPELAEVSLSETAVSESELEALANRKPGFAFTND